MKRILLAAPVALVMAFAVFSFMAWMIDNGGRKVPESKPALSFNMVMVENEQDVQRRQRSVPDKPEMPQVPEQAPVSQAQADVTPMTDIQAAPALGLDTSIHGVAINAPTFGDFGVNQQAVPINRVDPRYPLRAQKRKIEGYVSLSFTIDKSGRPTDIQVTDSEPKRIFDREAVRALSKWKYQPQIIDGKAVEQPNQTVKVEFKLAK
ncbi:energy transducer TonB [Vibrio sp. AK197]|uniref:Protein TonB n=1 Tax=Vibrio olivae TaxID=1243002 RepID=A0ABV5HIM3_9VIBR